MKRVMKRVFAILLCCTLLCVGLPGLASAADRSLSFLLTVDGESDVTVQSGDEITVTYTVNSSEEGSYDLNGIQNEIKYDESFFELVEDSVTLEKGRGQLIHKLVGDRVYMNDMLCTYEATQIVGSFKLKVTAASGSGKVESTECQAFDKTGAALAITQQDLIVRIGGVDPGPGPGPDPTTPIKQDADIIVTPVRPGTEASGEGKRNPDGSIDVTVWNRSGKVVPSVPGGVRVIIPNVGDGQVVVQLNEKGEIIDLVEKSLVENGTAYTLLPGTAKIKIIDNAKPFRDVSETDWFNEFVIFVSSHELFIGVEEDLFAPRMTMTRAMMVTVLWRLEDRPEAEKVSPFTDVVRNGWYDAAVDWAAENGVTLGYSDTEFGPRDNVTREQMATLLYRYLKDLGFDVSASADFSAYEDGGKVSSWAEEAMHWAVGSGLIIGRSETELAPRDTATRAEVATMFKRLVTMMVKP